MQGSTDLLNKTFEVIEGREAMSREKDNTRDVLPEIRIHSVVAEDMDSEDFAFLKL